MEVAGAREEGSETVLKRTSPFQVTDGVPILTFDPSVENFLYTMEAISALCGGTKEESFEASDIERFSSMIVFVREWKQFYFCEWMPFHYKSKTVNFSYQTESAEATNAINGIKLPHFSSAAVPKAEKLHSTASALDNDDFVLHVGGSIWALDWCPRHYDNIDCDIKCEYLAIAAHPTGSEYHKIGEQLSGRGFIQIWCFLHLGDKEEMLEPGGVHRKGKGNKKVNEDSCVPKRRGRPRKTVPSVPNKVNEATNIDTINNIPFEQFAVGGIVISNECCVSSELNTNEELKNSYGVGSLSGNKEVFEYSDNPIDGPPRKSRGRPRKTFDAKIPRPRGRPRKHPISSSNWHAVIHDDQLLNSSSLSTSGDVGTLSGSRPISVGCYVEELHEGINNVSNLNELGETIPYNGKPIHDVCSQFHLDDFGISLASLLPPGSNGQVRSFSSGQVGHKKSTVPTEHNIVSKSENLLVLPIPRVSKTSKESVVTKKALHVNSLGGFNGGRCAMKSCSTNRKREVNDETIIIYDNDQVVKTKGLSSISEDHCLEGSFLPTNVDDCREIVTVTENSVQDQSVIPEGIGLPRLMLSLAHNGKVAWDMKWRPFDAVDSKAKYHLGYLAVLLGNGSLEVWEVPVHNLVKILYADCHTEDTDPRFLKLQPVFRCSRMKFGERQSIPLTLEWSPSASRDLILVGCHDGTVALWKFCSQLSSKDTKPLLCFTADTVPIRSLAWAPDDSDAECSNLIVIGGHEGLKFWDLRSPYHPLLDLCPVQKAVLGLDWLKHPRCLVIAYEDGIMRTLSLTKISNDMPVTGEASAKAKQPGLHSQLCSFFAIWSVQVSRSSGLVAYCSSDGCTRYFQLTSEAVDKDSSRYRMPHFLCGSLAEEGTTLRINTPLKRIPLPKQPLVSKVAANEARPINSSMPALCWPDDHATNNSSSQKKRKGNPSEQAEAGEKGALHDIESRGDESRQTILRFPPKIVAMHKGSGSSLEDCVIHLLCPCCTLCQESRTLEINNVQDGIWHGRGDTICVGKNGVGSKEFNVLHKPSLIPTKNPECCNMERMSNGSGNHSWNVDISPSKPLVLPIIQDGET